MTSALRPSRFGDEFPALLDAARAGAPWAWRELHEWLAPAVAGYLRLQGALDAEDLTSEVFIGVFRGIAGFEGDEVQFRSWVFVIAHRRLTDQRRQRHRRVGIFADGATIDHVAGGDAEDEALVALSHDRVEALCQRLAPDQRDVLLLRLVGDLTVEQVAAALDKSVGAVKQLQRRGLEAIRRISAQEGVPL